MGALLSGLYTRADNINDNLAGLRQETRALPAEIARAIAAEMARSPRAQEVSMWDKVTKARDLLRVAFPYLVLVLVVLYKAEAPDQLPLLRLLAKLLVTGGLD